MRKVLAVTWLKAAGRTLDLVLEHISHAHACAVNPNTGSVEGAEGDLLVRAEQTIMIAQSVLDDLIALWEKQA